MLLPTRLGARRSASAIIHAEVSTPRTAEVTDSHVIRRLDVVTRLTSGCRIRLSPNRCGTESPAWLKSLSCFLRVISR